MEQFDDIPLESFREEAKRQSRHHFPKKEKRVSRVDTPVTVSTTSHSEFHVVDGELQGSRSLHGQDGVIFLMEGVLTTDLRHGCIVPTRRIPSLLLALCPRPFHPRHLFFVTFFSGTIFENVPRKFRDLGIFGYFTVASTEYPEL